jgi:transcriptional regulator with XRE-family HTH domain
VLSAHNNSPVPVRVTSTPRAQAGRRLRAARMLADVSLRDAASAAGLTYSHVSAIERGAEPLTASDCHDLGRVLDVPPSWLRNGWGMTRKCE